MPKAKNGADLLVQCLEAQGVKYIFGIPGAKVDTIFDVLADHGPRLILCRHEQNAAFMAGMYGLLTGGDWCRVLISATEIRFAFLIERVKYWSEPSWAAFFIQPTPS